jgi:hypothetical protein
VQWRTPGAGAPLLGVLPLSGTRARPGFRVFGRLARVRQSRSRFR